MNYPIQATSVPRQSQSTFRISLSRAMVPFLAVLYITALVLAFRFLVTKYWAYSGYRWDPPTAVIEWIIVLGAAIVPALVMSVTYKRPSRLVLWLFYVVVYVPACLVKPLTDGGLGSYWQFICWLMISFLILLFLTELPLLRISPLKIPFSVFITGLVLLSGFTFALSFWFYGIPTTIPTLSEVYEVRTLQRSRAEAAPLLLAYLAGWQYKVVNLLFMGLGIQLRKRYLFVGGVLGQLYYYAVTGHKSILFSTVLVIGIWVLTRRFQTKIGPMTLIATVGMILLTSALAFAGSIMLFSVFVRRLLVVPGSLTGQYYEYFTEFGFTRNLDPITRLIFESPYDMGAPALIALHFTGTIFSANANFWAAAYAGFGFGGMIFVSIVLGLMLWIINTMARGEYRLIGNILVALSTFSLTNSDLSTTIGTHGLGIALVFIVIQPIVSGPGPNRTDITSSANDKIDQP